MWQTILYSRLNSSVITILHKEAFWTTKTMLKAGWHDLQSLMLSSHITCFTNDVAFQKNGGVIVVLQFSAKLLLHQCIGCSAEWASLDSLISRWASVAWMELCEMAHGTSSNTYFTESRTWVSWKLLSKQDLKSKWQQSHALRKARFGTQQRFKE